MCFRGGAMNGAGSIKVNTPSTSVGSVQVPSLHLDRGITTAETVGHSRLKGLSYYV